jgi:hypothetical protein
LLIAGIVRAYLILGFAVLDIQANTLAADEYITRAVTIFKESGTSCQRKRLTGYSWGQRPQVQPTGLAGQCAVFAYDGPALAGDLDGPLAITCRGHPGTTCRLGYAISGLTAGTSRAFSARRTATVRATLFVVALWRAFLRTIDGEASGSFSTFPTVVVAGVLGPAASLIVAILFFDDSVLAINEGSLGATAFPTEAFAVRVGDTAVFHADLG